MSSHTLGIAYGYHDASASLVKDGRLIFSTTEDRLSRQKHDAQFPINAIRECLEKGNISPKDLDQITFHEDPYQKFSRIICSTFAGYPRTRREFSSSMLSWLKGKLWPFHEIAEQLDVDPAKIFYFNHHYSHALTGFLGSGFDDAAILVVDAVGDWACTSIYSARWSNSKPAFEKVYESHFPHSLGLVYSAFTEFLGFKPNDSECSTMALASFGEPKYVGEIGKMVSQESDRFTVRQEFFNFITYSEGATSKHFENIFGEARSASSVLKFSSFEKIADPKNQKYADIAASIQSVFSQTVLDLAEKARVATKSSNLCISGGGAMNCVANSFIMKNSKFENYHVPIDPGDGGSSIGPALYANLTLNDQTRQPVDLVYLPYMGVSSQKNLDLKYLELLDPRKFLRFEKVLNSQAPTNRWKRKNCTKENGIAETVKLLVAGYSVGILNGASEIGPRALGNRSILIRPDDVAVAMKLSETVKKRARFRLYALSMLPEFALKSLVLTGDIKKYRWMQFTAEVKDEFRDRLKAAVHIDGTTRPHICYQEDNPEMHRLLQAFEKNTGIGAILNTSFNESGKPLVATGYDALIMFARTSLNALVIDYEQIIRKEDYYAKNQTHIHDGDSPILSVEL